jgi:RNA polymerase sigma-70 factor (ECF subfamily)
MQEYSDPRQLIIAAKNGDTAAFGKLYELYYTPVFRYIYVRTTQRQLAEDLAQTVFVKAFESVNRYQATTSPPLAYLFTIARNSVIDHWKKKKDVLFQEEDAAVTNIIDHQQNPAHHAEVKSSVDAIKRTIAALPPDQQDVVTMKFINELTNKEIAEALDKSEDAVRQLQSRALKTIRANAQHYGIL